jgi:hypothetical protein
MVKVLKRVEVMAVVSNFQKVNKFVDKFNDIREVNDMQSDLRLIEIADSDDVLVFHKDEEIAIISKDLLGKIIAGHVSEVASFRKF